MQCNRFEACRLADHLCAHTLVDTCRWRSRTNGQESSRICQICDEADVSKAAWAVTWQAVGSGAACETVDQPSGVYPSLEPDVRGLDAMALIVCTCAIHPPILTDLKCMRDSNKSHEKPNDVGIMLCH